MKPILLHASGESEKTCMDNQNYCVTKFVVLTLCKKQNVLRMLTKKKVPHLWMSCEVASRRRLFNTLSLSPFGIPN